MNLPPFWHLERFGDLLERWIEQEAPPADIRATVVAWTFARYDEPYKGGLQRQSDQPNFYWGAIPGTVRGGKVVTCGYWIFEAERTVKCYGYASLSMPI